MTDVSPERLIDRPVHDEAHPPARRNQERIPNIHLLNDEGLPAQSETTCRGIEKSRARDVVFRLLEGGPVCDRGGCGPSNDLNAVGEGGADSLISYNGDFDRERAHDSSISHEVCEGLPPGTTGAAEASPEESPRATLQSTRRIPRHNLMIHSPFFGLVPADFPGFITVPSAARLNKGPLALWGASGPSSVSIQICIHMGVGVRDREHPI